METNDLMVSKYPYLSTAPNLFDYFLIIGYDQSEIINEIVKLIEDNCITPKISIFKTINSSSSNFFSIYSPQSLPEVINSIAPNIERQSMLEEERIIKLAFPDPPSVYYYVIDPNIKETYTPNQYSVIFMMNSDSTEAGKKNTLNGYNYIFYEMKEKKVEVKNTAKDSSSRAEIKVARVFIPKAFCFLSQYPYYSQFSKLAQRLLAFFIKTEYSSIPIEILIFNIINFSPSPFKSKIYLSPFPEQLDNKPSGDPESVLTLHQLSGYPIFDFNFSEIFSILPIETIADILIFNQLEIDMLFFSKNIEVLNIVMYIISSLNYPLNDSIYHWQINSVSRHEFEDNCNTIYMGKPNTSMLGVNYSYTSKFDVYAFSKAPFIADLDNKEFSFKDKTENGDENFQEDSDEKKTVQLIRYIHDIISLKKTVNNSHFEKSLILLMNELESKAKKVIHLNSNQSNQIVPKFLTGDNSNYATNKMIQELFYEFNLNIFYLFYQFIVVKEDRTKKNAKNSFFIDIKQSKNKRITLSPEEENICELISNGSKISVFLENFIKDHNALDVYRIPLMFAEEFLNIKAAGSSDEKFKMSPFDIMDKFYSVSNKESNAEHLNFNSFFDYYNKEMKEEYMNYMKESPLFFQTKITNSKQAYQYKSVELDNNILFKYMYHINNLPDKKLMDIFPLFKIQKNLSVIEKIPSKNITNYIEKSLLSSKMLTLNDLVCINFIVFYAMTLDQNILESLKYFGIITIFKNIKYCQRKYLLLLLELYLKLYNKTKSIQVINNANELMNYILENNILPNEEMMDILAKYTQAKQELREELGGGSTPRATNSNSTTFTSLITQVPDEKNTDTINESNGEKDDLLTFDKNNFKDFKNKKMYLKKNNCRDGTLKEDAIMKYADSAIYDGNLKISCPKCNNDINPVFFFQEKKDMIETNIYSALKVLNNLFDLYKNKYYKMNFDDFNTEDLKSLSIIALNLVFYLNNTQIITNADEKNAFEYFLIFYLKKYNQKSKK